MSNTEKSEAQILIDLLEYATPAQERVLRAIIEHGSHRKAADELGLAHGTISAHMMQVRKVAASKGYSPDHDMTNTVPAPFVVKGTSTLYDDEGNVKQQWVKSQVDNAQLMAMAKASAKAFFSEQEPLPTIDAPEGYQDDDLLTVYPLADLHLGMFSWAKETGADFDCDIASRLIIAGFRKLIDRTPPSRYCLIPQLGDLMHLDDDSNQTRRSGNALDVDTRFARVARVALKVYRAVIDMALEKHEKVKVVNVPGNHDDVSGMWVGLAVETAYENNPRVEVDNSPGPYFYHSFGENLLGMCHGHTCKPDALGEIMASDLPYQFGSTTYRYWLTGHIHHLTTKESRLCVVESFRTLAARDAWHHGAGYRAKRDIRAIVYHRDFGESDRFIVGLREIEKTGDK